MKNITREVTSDVIKAFNLLEGAMFGTLAGLFIWGTFVLIFTFEKVEPVVFVVPLSIGIGMWLSQRK